MCENIKKFGLTAVKLGKSYKRNSSHLTVVNSLFAFNGMTICDKSNESEFTS
jgi:hypothetical protein